MGTLRKSSKHQLPYLNNIVYLKIFILYLTMNTNFIIYFAFLLFNFLSNLSKSNSQLQEHPSIKNGGIFDFKPQIPLNTFQNQAEITLNYKELTDMYKEPLKCSGNWRNCKNPCLL